jgi:hypothetical protein
MLLKWAVEELRAESAAFTARGKRNDEGITSDGGDGSGLSVRSNVRAFVECTIVFGSGAADLCPVE